MDNRVSLEKKFLKELSKSVTPKCAQKAKKYTSTRESTRKYSRLLEKIYKMLK